MTSAWSKVWVREARDAEEQGIEPLWLPPARFSDASCRWLIQDSTARCSYQRTRFSQDDWRDEEANLELTDAGWDFGY